jgi:hypothetical protein
VSVDEDEVEAIVDCDCGQKMIYPALCGSSCTDLHIRFSSMTGVYPRTSRDISDKNLTIFLINTPPSFSFTFSPFQFV